MTFIPGRSGTGTCEALAAGGGRPGAITHSPAPSQNSRAAINHRQQRWFTHAHATARLAAIRPPAPIPILLYLVKGFCYLFKVLLYLFKVLWNKPDYFVPGFPNKYKSFVQGFPNKTHCVFHFLGREEGTNDLSLFGKTLNKSWNLEQIIVSEQKQISCSLFRTKTK